MVSIFLHQSDTARTLRLCGDKYICYLCRLQNIVDQSDCFVHSAILHLEVWGKCMLVAQAAKYCGPIRLLRLEHHPSPGGVGQVYASCTGCKILWTNQIASFRAPSFTWRCGDKCLLVAQAAEYQIAAAQSIKMWGQAYIS